MKKILFVVVAAFVSIGAMAQIKIGDTAPEIMLPNLKDSVVNLSSYKGKVVLIDFWASWCGPCRAANPSVVRLYKKYKGKGFEVFGISLDDKKAAWLKAIKQDNIKYIQVNDKDGWNSKVAATYFVDQIPTNFLLDKNGKVVAIDLEGKKLDDAVKKLL